MSNISEVETLCPRVRTLRFGGTVHGSGLVSARPWCLMRREGGVSSADDRARLTQSVGMELKQPTLSMTRETRIVHEAIIERVEGGSGRQGESYSFCKRKTVVPQ